MLENMKVRNITTCDINNGTGVRCTVWVQGCNRKCPGCHNPELWPYGYGKRLMSDTVFSVIRRELNKSYIDGITFSGGDPFDQDERALRELLVCLKELKGSFPDKTIWVYTGGYYRDEIKKPLVAEMLPYIDVIVDGPYKQELRDITIPFRGSKNQRIIDVQATLKDGRVILIPDSYFKV